MLKIIVKYHTNLFASKKKILSTVRLANTSVCPDEISFALQNVKCGKGLGEDGIVTDLLKYRRISQRISTVIYQLQS